MAAEVTSAAAAAAMDAPLAAPVATPAVAQYPLSWPAWSRLSMAILETAEEHDESHTKLLACTNYQDMQLMSLINGLARKKKFLTAPQVARLGDALTSFLASLDADGFYIIRGSGSYWLKLERQDLEGLAAVMREGVVSDVYRYVVRGLKTAPTPPSVLAMEAQWNAAVGAVARPATRAAYAVQLAFLFGLGAAATYCVQGWCAAA